MKDYSTIKFPVSRLATFDVGKIGNSKHHITGLLETDVTDARKRVRELVRTGKDIGFISWLIKCIAMTIAGEPVIQAVNSSGTKQVVFRDVDISLTLERTVGGKKVPLAALLRNADKKGVEELQAEINSFREQKVESEEDYVLGDGGAGWKARLFFHMPQWIRMIFWRTVLRNPFARKKAMGTAVVTNVGLTGGVAGWIIPTSIHNLAIGIGSINKRPWVVGDQICIRDILHLTVLFDHDVVDGAPAARFTSRLIRNIESGKYAD